VERTAGIFTARASDFKRVFGPKVCESLIAGQETGTDGEKMA
jgi:hypothetical protein